MRKERFLTQVRSNLQLLKGEGPFQVVEQILDNAYRLDLLGEYNVSTTSNVSYFTPFNVGKNESAQRKKESYDASST